MYITAETPPALVVERAVTFASSFSPEDYPKKPHPLALTVPHRAYVVIGTDKGLADAQAVAWRFFLVRNDDVLGAVQVEDGAERALSLERGEFPRATSRELTAAEAHDARSGQPHEFRVLTFPGLFVRTIWLAGAEDVVIPLAPVPPRFEPSRRYDADTFLRVLRRST